MKRILFTLMIIGSICASLSSQKYFTRNGNISFVSDTPMEKIEAMNKDATSVLDTETGRMEFAVLIKSFHFEKALMEEHFNENYMDSNKFPKSTFKGQVDNIEEVNFEEDGKYDVAVSGDLTIHGVTQKINTTGVIQVAGGEILAASNFDVAIADYDIKIPKVVRENIAKTVVIDVELVYEILQ